MKFTCVLFEVLSLSAFLFFCVCFFIARTWLLLTQVHIPSPKKINHSHYDVTKPNEQHQFDLPYVPHNIFEGNTYKYILAGVDVGIPKFLDSGPKCWTVDSERWTLDVGLWTLDSRCWTLDTEFWTLDTGHCR